MFICAKCRKVTKPREKVTRLVVETREKRYYPSGTGRETVKEISICNACATPKVATVN